MILLSNIIQEIKYKKTVICNFETKISDTKHAMHVGWVVKKNMLLYKSYRNILKVTLLHVCLCGGYGLKCKNYMFYQLSKLSNFYETSFVTNSKQQVNVLDS